MKLHEVEIGKTYRLGKRNISFFPTGAEVVVKEIGAKSIVTKKYHDNWIVVQLVEETEGFHHKDTQVVEAFELEEL